MVKRLGADQDVQPAKVCSAMIADQQPVSLQFLQIAADRGFRNGESLAQNRYP